MFKGSGLACGDMTIAGGMCWTCARCEHAAARTASMR